LHVGSGKVIESDFLRAWTQFQQKGGWFVLLENAAVCSTVVMNPWILWSVGMVMSPLMLPQL
jgi:hypothetical protein